MAEATNVFGIIDHYENAIVFHFSYLRGDDLAECHVFKSKRWNVVRTHDGVPQAHLDVPGSRVDFDDLPLYQLVHSKERLPFLDVGVGYFRNKNKGSNCRANA